ncbi:MAG: NAD(P)-dependent alcohol dehydrogenase [Lachnospiraceae bacterium]|jgi:L-iditol 2-dehydrogenase|nr:NAD(P)-dependent alcohol dehydrogenase [Lachnospiraceae bacterium]
MKNQAVVMTDTRVFEIQDVPMPEIGDDEVGIAVKDVSICGSDMHFFDGGAYSIFPKETALPFVLGHEVGGEVYAVGKNVKNVKIGDRVAVEPGVPCGKCDYCRSGRYNLCPDVVFLATPPVQGALKRYISYPAHSVYTIPDNMSTMEAALCEPLSVGLSAVRTGEVTVGSSVVILGGGCIGLCTLLAAKAYGATRIIVTDLFDFHLEKALELGATDVVNSKNEDAVAKIQELTGGKGVDVVFETAGSPYTAAQTSEIVGRGGTIIMVGNIMQETPFSFRNMYKKGATLKSIFRYCNTYPIAIQAIASGRIDVKKIVSAEFDFEHSQAAFEEATDNKVNCVKAVIHVE